MEDLAWGTIPGPDGSPIGSRGGLRRASGISGVVEKLSKLANSVFSRGETRIRLTLNLSGSRTFREPWGVDELGLLQERYRVK